MQAHPYYKEKYKANPDSQNREIAYVKIFNDMIAKNRKNELDLYRLMSQDASFKKSIMDTLKRLLDAASYIVKSIEIRRDSFRKIEEPGSIVGYTILG